MQKIQAQRTRVVVDELRTVKVAPGGELDRLLDEVNGASLILERDGARYRLTREPDEDIWEGYDPEAVRKALAETAGSWADLDTDKLIADVYRWREEGSRPADRP